MTKASKTKKKIMFDQLKEQTITKPEDRERYHTETSPGKSNFSHREKSPILHSEKTKCSAEKSLNTSELAGNMHLENKRLMGYFRNRSVSLGQKPLSAGLKSSSLDTSSYENVSQEKSFTQNETLERSIYRSNPPTSDIMVDYIHKKIKHRPKTAFGSVIPGKYKAIPDTTACIKTSKRAVKRVSIPCGLRDYTESNYDFKEREPIGVDTYINCCIQDAQAVRIKPSERPQSSLLFSKILDEFMSSDEDDDWTSGMKPLSRERATSLSSDFNPVSILKKRSTPSCTTVRIKLPNE